jgi:general secretion pathway protein N
VSRWSWLALGVGAYVAFMLATFPAGTALRWFAPPEVTFVGVAGTLWSGSAASCAAGGFRAEALRWRLRPASLLLGRISANVEARIPDGFVAGDLTASPSSVRFNNVRAGMSLPALAALLPAVRGMRGQASVALQLLVLEDGWPAAAVGELKLAGLEAPPLISDGSGTLLPLGDYTVTFVPAPQGQLSANVVDNGGPLEVVGTASLDAARNYTVDLLVEPRAGAPEMLVEGLKYMTPDPDAQGRRRLNTIGSL